MSEYSCVVYLVPISYGSLAGVVLWCSYRLRQCTDAWIWLYLSYFFIALNAITKLFLSDMPVDRLSMIGGRSQRRKYYKRSRDRCRLAAGAGKIPGPSNNSSVSSTEPEKRKSCCPIGKLRPTKPNPRERERREKEREQRNPEVECNEEQPLRTRSCPASRRPSICNICKNFEIDDSSCSMCFIVFIQDASYYLSTLYALPGLLTQVLIDNGIQDKYAIVPLLVTVLPLMVYLIDNVKDNSMLDLLVVGHVVFLSAFGAHQKAEFGIGTAMSFAVTHFVLRSHRMEGVAKEIFYNTGIAVYCLLALQTIGVPLHD